MPLALLFILAFALAWPNPARAASAPSGSTVYVDGRPQTATTIVQNGYQLVPASFFRGLSVTVDWSRQYRAAVLRTTSIQIGFPGGERHADYQRAAESAWQRDHLDTRTTLIGGTAYVPLAYTARKLGFGVEYDASARAARISTGGRLSAASAKQNQPSDEELRWLYRITEAEAGGESYTGKVAVAASILNRVAGDEWPNTIVDTIFQVAYYNGQAYYQYSPVLDKRIYTVAPSPDTIRAVHDALNGSDPGRGAVVFYNPMKTDNAWVRSRPVTARIGNHVFAK